jgi:hypothetical protein
LRTSQSILRGLKRLFTSDQKNWKVVALCVLGATTFWFFNALNKDYATRINYPVEFVFDEEGVVVVEELPERVSIVVSGGGWNLLRKTLWFNINPIQVLLENPTAQRYITKASLTSIVADQLNELRLQYVVTDTLYLHIDEELSKKVALVIDSAGISLEQDHRIVSPVEVTPDSVLFTGPSSFINNLADSILLYVPYKQLNKSFNEQIELSQLESDIIQVQPELVQVQFEVARFTRAEKQVRIRPENFPPDTNFQLQDSVATVHFTVQDEYLDNAMDASIELIADYRNRNMLDSVITITLGDHPPFIKDVEVAPETVQLQYDPARDR